jgi:hypothetical protein
MIFGGCKAHGVLIGINEETNPRFRRGGSGREARGGPLWPPASGTPYTRVFHDHLFRSREKGYAGIPAPQAGVP